MASRSQPSIREMRPVGLPPRSVSTPSPDDAVKSQQLEGSRVQHPLAAGPFLHPNGAFRDHPVEQVAVDGPGDALVVADAPDPGAGWRCPSDPAQRVHEPIGIDHLGRPEPHRGPGRRGREQVDVVVVEAGQDGATMGVEDLVGDADLEGRPDR